MAFPTGMSPDVADLNALEQMVLAACIGAAEDATGGDFGMTDEAYSAAVELCKVYGEPALSKPQFKGYLGQLVTKGYIVSDGGGTRVNGSGPTIHQFFYGEKTLKMLDRK
jgi:hypothetical protein